MALNGLKLTVYPNVYPPSEDSYILLDALRGLNAKKVLEIGCGCGIISIMLALRGIEVFSIDVSKDACRNTLFNAKRNHTDSMVHVINTDMVAALRKSIVFDAIISNPPYIPVEKSLKDDASWAAGVGNSFFKKMVEEAISLLSEKGVMMVVQSSLSNLNSLKNILTNKDLMAEEVFSKSFFFERIVVLKITRSS
ncbi:MAG: HemK2/MTQ2 family protein methyltransferase [Thermoproteota archaeon]